MLTIYTDGSCEPNPGPGGWGFVVYEAGSEVLARSGGEGATTNNRMELRAVLEALRWLGGRPALIRSDSQYVVNGVTAWSARWKLRGWMRTEKKKLIPVISSDLWQAIDAARAPGQRFEWVRAHRGERGNERADRLANEARINGLVGAKLPAQPPRISFPATGLYSSPQSAYNHSIQRVTLLDWTQADRS